MNNYDIILKLIKDYQADIVLVMSVFEEKFGVKIIPHLCRDGKYPRIGSIPEAGITRFHFHGIGFGAEFIDKYVDFDFAGGPDHYRHDGLDAWFLWEYANSRSSFYPEYQIKELMDHDFNELIKNGIIGLLDSENYSRLYFFK